MTAGITNILITTSNNLPKHNKTIEPKRPRRKLEKLGSWITAIHVGMLEPPAITAFVMLSDVYILCLWANALGGRQDRRR